MEAQAHRFAGAFLPAETFASEVRVPPLDDLLTAEAPLGVSAAAIIMRTTALELLDDDGALILHPGGGLLGGAGNRTGDEDRRPEQPRCFAAPLICY